MIKEIKRNRLFNHFFSKLRYHYISDSDTGSSCDHRVYFYCFGYDDLFEYNDTNNIISVKSTTKLVDIMVANGIRYDDILEDEVLYQFKLFLGNQNIKIVYD